MDKQHGKRVKLEEGPKAKKTHRFTQINTKKKKKKKLENVRL